MKVWFGFGSEHSANLVIIGEFKSPHDAAEMHSIIDHFTAAAKADQAAA